MDMIKSGRYEIVLVINNPYYETIIFSHATELVECLDELFYSGSLDVYDLSKISCLTINLLEN